MVDFTVPVGDKYSVNGLTAGVRQVVAPSANTSGINIRIFGIFP